MDLILKYENVITLGIFFYLKKRRRKTVDGRVQERKQRALKKHPLAVKLDINCKGRGGNIQNCLFLTWSVFLQHTEYFSSCFLQTYFLIFIQMGIICIWPSTFWWPWRSSLSISASLWLIATHPPSQEGRILICLTVFQVLIYQSPFIYLPLHNELHFVRKFVVFDIQFFRFQCYCKVEHELMHTFCSVIFFSFITDVCVMFWWRHCHDIFHKVEKDYWRSERLPCSFMAHNYLD